MDLTAVPGLPETALGPELLAGLPEAVPPAPWELELAAVLWPSRPPRRGAGALPPALAASARLVCGGGGLIRYAHTPVGGYSEVLAGALVLRRGRPGVHVPFMAVDSHASLVGGRANWSLPKTLARFEGGPGGAGSVRALGQEWELRARVRPLGPAFPFRARLDLLQEWPDGAVRRSVGRMRGRARLAAVRLDAAGGPELRAWLRAGMRLGVVVERARGVLGPAS